MHCRYIGCDIWKLAAFYEGEIFWGSLLLGIIGVFIALLLAARFIMPYYIYKHSIINRGEYFLEFSEEGIHFKASGIDSKLNWTMYNHVVADSEHYMLYYGKNQYTIIPKRVFKPADQLKAFEILLQKHIKDVNV